MTAKLRLMLVDDHTLVRSGLRLMLESQPDMEVVGEAADGEEALSVAARDQPDIILMDLSMPGLGGLEALHRIKAERPWIRVLVVTMHDDPEFVRAALAAGAAGYVLKLAADGELLTAIRTVARGATYVYPTLAARVVAALAQPVAAPAGPGTPTQRELEVLQLIALGYTNQEIADRLVVSVKTVETHKARIMEKLGARNRAALVRYALAHGLIRA